MALADAASATSCFPALATSCFLPGLPSDARTTPRASPTAPHSLPSSPPPLFLSPSRTRAEPPPPTSTTAATVSPSTPRCACELRHHPLHLLVELRTSRTCCNAATIAVSIAGRRGSSSSIHHHRRVPEPANHPYGHRCELPRLPSLFPPSIAPCSPDPTGAASSAPPAMSPPSLQVTELASEHDLELVDLPGARPASQLARSPSVAPCPCWPELRSPPRTPFR